MKCELVDLHTPSELSEVGIEVLLSIVSEVRGAHAGTSRYRNSASGRRAGQRAKIRIVFDCDYCPTQIARQRDAQTRFVLPPVEPAEPHAPPLSLREGDSGSTQALAR